MTGSSGSFQSSSVSIYLAYISSFCLWGCFGDDVKNLAEVEISNLSLFLLTQWASDLITEIYQICEEGFSLHIPVLMYPSYLFLNLCGNSFLEDLLHDLSKLTRVLFPKLSSSTAHMFVQMFESVVRNTSSVREGGVLKKLWCVREHDMNEWCCGQNEV